MARNLLGMSPESLRLRLRIVVIITLVSSAAGAAYGAVTADGGAVNALRGLITGAAISLPLGAFEVLYGQAPAGRALVRLPFAAVVAIKSGLYLAVFAAVLAGNRMLFHDAVIPLWRDPSFWSGMAFSAAIGLAVNIMLQIDSLLGRGVLASFVIGRYHRPRVEERVFLFLDMVDSTGWAERLGGPRFMKLLDRLYHDIAEPIVAHRGEIHKYVGDEVIVTWRPNDALPRADCVRLPFAVRALLAANAKDYVADFGATPRLRFALHAGMVVSGELGSLKREIAFLGDAMNTTSRLFDAAREHGVEVIASDALLSRLALPAGIAASPLGAVALRGKAEKLAVFALGEASC